MAAIGNFEAIISNRVCQISIKFRFFTSLQLWQISWISPRINSYCGEQYAEPHPHALTTQRGTHYNNVTILPDHYSTSVPGSDLAL